MGDAEEGGGLFLNLHPDDVQTDEGGPKVRMVCVACVWCVVCGVCGVCVVCMVWCARCGVCGVRGACGVYGVCTRNMGRLRVSDCDGRVTSDSDGE